MTTISLNDLCKVSGGLVNQGVPVTPPTCDQARQALANAKDRAAHLENDPFVQLGLPALAKSLNEVAQAYAQRDIATVCPK